MAITEKQARELRCAISRALSTHMELGHLRGWEEAREQSRDLSDALEYRGSLYEAAAKARGAYGDLMDIYSELANN